MLPVALYPRAAVGENVIIHDVDADQGDPRFLARPTNRADSASEKDYRKRSQRPF